MDGPAIEYPDGSKTWYLNDKVHRTDGPAVEGVDGTKEWWIDDQLHREDGPAIEYPDGTKEYWLHGYKAWFLKILNKILTRYSCFKF
jgi:hypothetical protein